MTIVKCMSYIQTKYTSVALLKSLKFGLLIKSTSMLTLPINSTLFIISNCSNRKSQLITPLWIKKLTEHKRLNKINSRHMQDKHYFLRPGISKSSSNTKEFTEHNHRNHSLKHSTSMICLIIVSKHLLPISIINSVNMQYSLFEFIEETLF